MHSSSKGLFAAAVLLLLALPQSGKASPVQDACLPITMPSNDVLFSAKRKVFSHYFNIFSLSMDNKPTESDYYTLTWLVARKDNMWYPNGGFLRTRPLPVRPGPTVNGSKISNLEKEIRLAIARGITGFTYDVARLKDIEPAGNLDNMLKAAAAVDSRFKIALMVDSMAPNEVITLVKLVYHNPNIYKIDGKVVVTPFMADRTPVADWQAMKTTLAGEGYPVYFMPTFLSLPQSVIATYAPVSEALGLFGTAVVSEGETVMQNTAASHAAGKPYMAGISPQGYRPKVFVYWETQNSLGYRNGWMAAIQSLPEWIQLTTWNDYSETTQVSPYTDLSGTSGTGFYDLTGYFASWYITGRQPSITHDVLYYFYRKQSVKAPAPNAKQPTVSALSWVPGTDLIELVGFLTKPGTLSISIHGQTFTKEVGAGLQSFTVPLAQGTPVFSLLRNGATAVTVKGDAPIAGPDGLPTGFSDMTYWTGSASATGTCSHNAEVW